MTTAYDGVPEFFVEGLDHIDLLGTSARYTMYCTITDGGVIVRRPKVLIVMPNANLPEALGQCAKVPVNELAFQVRRLMPMWAH